MEIKQYFSKWWCEDGVDDYNDYVKMIMFWCYYNIYHDDDDDDDDVDYVKMTVWRW